MSTKLKPIAILIDGDNVPVEIVPAFLDKVSKRRNPIIKELFFNKYSFEKWELIINNFSLRANLVPNNIPGKNSADIALVISAMQIFYEREDIEEFYIISSDSDFAGLAKHIARTGKPVYGVGENKTPESFQNACTRFWYIEELIDFDNPTIEPENEPIQAEETQQSITDIFPEHLFVQAYERAPKKKNKWVEANILKKEMMKLDENFTSSDYRTTKEFIKRVKMLATVYPDNLLSMRTEKKDDSNKLLAYIRIPDCDVFKFIEVYKRCRVNENSEWVSLSDIGKAIKIYPLYQDGFRYQKSKTKGLSKVVAEMLKDYGSIIEMRGKRRGKTVNHSIRVKI